jgi:hypothetical protein
MIFVFKETDIECASEFIALGLKYINHKWADLSGNYYNPDKLAVYETISKLLNDICECKTRWFVSTGMIIVIKFNNSIFIGLDNYAETKLFDKLEIDLASEKITSRTIFANTIIDLYTNSTIRYNFDYNDTF